MSFENDINQLWNTLTTGSNLGYIMKLKSIRQKADGLSLSRNYLNQAYAIQFPHQLSRDDMERGAWCADFMDEFLRAGIKQPNLETLDLLVRIQRIWLEACE